MSPARSVRRTPAPPALPPSRSCTRRLYTAHPTFWRTTFPPRGVGVRLRRRRNALPSGSENLMNIVTGHYALPVGDLLAGLYGLFIKPVYASRPILPGLSDLPLCPPRLRRPGADALCTRLVYGRRVPVCDELLGGLPLLDTRGGVYLVHAVHDIPALRAGCRQACKYPPHRSPTVCLLVPPGQWPHFRRFFRDRKEFFTQI